MEHFEPNDALLSSQARIFYQEMHSQKCLTHNFTKITWINALLFPRAGGLTDIFSAKYDFLLLLLIYKYKSLR